MLTHVEALDVFLKHVRLFAFIYILSYLWFGFSLFGILFWFKGALSKLSLFTCSIIFLAHLSRKVFWKFIFLQNSSNRRFIKSSLCWTNLRRLFLISLIWGWIWRSYFILKSLQHVDSFFMRNSSIVNRRDRCFSFCYGLLFWVVSSTIKLHYLFVVVSCTSINLLLWNRWTKLFIEGCWSHNSSFLFMRTDQIFAVLHDSLMV